jgi:hypothetical protein
VPAKPIIKELNRELTKRNENTADIVMHRASAYLPVRRSNPRSEMKVSLPQVLIKPEECSA